MFAVQLGLVAAGAVAIAKGNASSRDMGSMTSMGSAAASSAHGFVPSIVGALNRFGPEILVGSVALVVLALAARRSIGLVPALGGGIILYVGMYVQTNVTIMWLATVAGLGLLGLAALGPKMRERTSS